MGLNDGNVYCKITVKSTVNIEINNLLQRVLVVAGNFSPLHCIQTSSGAHPASYPMGTRGSFLGGKA
jgi:hypothetical protein